MIPVDKNMQPLDDYYLWCDHRAKGEAAEITEAAHQRRAGSDRSGAAVCIPRSGVSPSCCTGCGTIRRSAASSPRAFEHCDMVAATLCGITDPQNVKRSICAMGHKWMWNRGAGRIAAGGVSGEASIRCLTGCAEKLDGEYATSDEIAGHLSAYWAEQLGLKAGIPIPVGAFDAHWDAIGAGCRTDDMVNVVGTSTCIIGITPSANLVPGVCGVVQGSVHPQRTGIEAGLSAVGDIFNAIANRAGTERGDAERRDWKTIAPGRPGLLRMTWDNGDRTVLVNPELARHHSGLESADAPRRMNCLPPSRARRFTRGSFWIAWRSTAFRSSA